MCVVIFCLGVPGSKVEIRHVIKWVLTRTFVCPREELAGCRFATEEEAAVVCSAPPDAFQATERCALATATDDGFIGSEELIHRQEVAVSKIDTHGAHQRMERNSGA